jgi:hypothetical protein
MSVVLSFSNSAAVSSKTCERRMTKLNYSFEECTDILHSIQDLNQHLLTTKDPAPLGLKDERQLSLHLRILIQFVIVPCTFLSDHPQIENQHELLFQTCLSFVNWIKHRPALSASPGQLIVHQYLLQLYAALLQLHLQPSSYHDQSLELFMECLDLIPYSISFMTLISLNSKPLAWLREGCGRYLSKLITRDGGISSFMSIFVPKNAKGSGMMHVLY